MAEEICISIVPLYTHIPKAVHKAANILAQRGLTGLGSVRPDSTDPHPAVRRNTITLCAGSEDLLALLVTTAVSGAHIC